MPFLGAMRRFRVVLALRAGIPPARRSFLYRQQFAVPVRCIVFGWSRQARTGATTGGSSNSPRRKRELLLRPASRAETAGRRGAQMRLRRATMARDCSRTAWPCGINA
jgi:hypothetical protein